MASLTRENTAARNRLRMHQGRINNTVRPRRRLAQSWAWLYAEARLLPDDQVEALAHRVARVAAWLNTRRSR